MAKAPTREPLSLSGPAGLLEGLLEVPAGFAGDRIAIVCHPHPLYQGTMHNKVVHTLSRAMNDLGLAAVRFNFRGVGSSDGEYADGEGEMADLQAVAGYARERWPAAELWLAGFSFGAVITARMAKTLAAAQLVSIAPAVTILESDLVESPDMPWLIVHGDTDEVVEPDAVMEWVATLAPAPEFVLLQGSGHFFHGQLVELRELLVAKLRIASGNP